MMRKMMSWIALAAALALAVGLNAQEAPPEGPRSPEASTAFGEEVVPAEGLARRLEGTLRRSPSRLLFFRPPYAFYLEGQDGKRRAWLRLDSRVTPGPLTEFLDQPVVVVGHQAELKGNSKPVVDVKTLTRL